MANSHHTQNINIIKRKKTADMKYRNFLLQVLILLVVTVYLFVNAPPPLAENSRAEKSIPIQDILKIVNFQNNEVRALYTREIVGKGKKTGIKFDEHWKDNDMHAGPLPAQFLRETARSLEKNPVKLGLYLGSDYPINTANEFEGKQLEMFRLLKEDRKPRYFTVGKSQRIAYIFPDIAIVKSCVTCHNKHIDSPKSNWKLNDVMGATTWTYPVTTLSVQESIEILVALRQGFQDAYSVFLEEMNFMPLSPEVGAQWPAHGYFVPSLKVFMSEVDKRIAIKTLNELVSSATRKEPVVEHTIQNKSKSKSPS